MQGIYVKIIDCKSAFVFKGRPLTADAWIGSQVSPREILGGKTGSGIVFYFS